MTDDSAEFKFKNCTCQAGMRDGKRCGDCGGRGVVPKGYVFGSKPAVVEEPQETALATDDDLENISVVNLRTRAKDLGLSSAGSKASIVQRIREFHAAERGEELEANPNEAEGESEGEEPEED